MESRSLHVAGKVIYWWGMSNDSQRYIVWIGSIVTPLGTCQKHKFSSSTPDLQDRNLKGAGPDLWVLRNPLGDSDATVCLWVWNEIHIIITVYVLKTISRQKQNVLQNSLVSSWGKSHMGLQQPWTEKKHLHPRIKEGYLHMHCKETIFQNASLILEIL